MSLRAARLALALAALLFATQAATPARAHEPLWGESPQTFAFGIWHPELRFGFEDDRVLLRGSARLDNADALRRLRYDTLLSVQWAPRTSLNLKLEVPVSSITAEQRIGGVVRRASTTGLGNIMLSAKDRFHVRFGADWKEMQSYSVGIQLPTGQHSGRYPDGTPLDPGDQPGSGKWGYMFGYAYDYERLKDTVWASVSYSGDLGGAGSMGDMLEADANYGYWVIRALHPQDLGVILAAGPHYEWMGHDRTAAGRDPDSGFSMAGLQASLIATKGQAQARVGVLVPLYQHVNGTQVRPELEVRAGVEALF